MKTARTRIKICGIRDPGHALDAAREGADAIGLVFHAASPRNVSLDEARKVCAVLPPFVASVGLFVDAGEDRVREVLEAVPIDILQFHGGETPEFCARFNRPYLRAVPMAPGVDLLEWARRFSNAKALLLDTHTPGLAGGTGRTFDWARIPSELPLPIVLSGGLNPENVAAAIGAVRPWAVDVSSGVESARGVKDPARIVEFIRSVRRESLRPA